MGNIFLIPNAIIIVFFTYIFVLWMRHWSYNRQILDIPNERSLHTKPIPRGGGLAIVLITLLSIFVYLKLFPSEIPIYKLMVYVTCAGIISLLGWLDDLYNLHPLFRLGIQTAIALIMIIFIGYWKTITLPIIGDIDLGWGGYALTIIWVVGLTNAYNFMDGVDGMATGQSVIAGIGWVIIGQILISSEISFWGMVVSSSCMGFLCHNWHPARIFLGDVGSYFLGFTFSVFPLLINHNPISALLGFLLVWPFVFDALITFMRRIVQRKNVFSPHCSHYYQRLVISGLSHKLVAVLYIGLSITGLLGSISLLKQFYSLTNIIFVIILLAVLSLIFVTLWREKKIEKCFLNNK